MPEHTPEAAPVEAAAAPPQAVSAVAAPMSAPMGAQLARSASAMGNHAFGRWAQTAGAAGDPMPSLSAHSAWGPVLARDPEGGGGTATAPAPSSSSATGAQASPDDDTEEPIDVKGLQFGKSLLDTIIPASGGDMTKSFNTHLGKKADFPGIGLQVPLFPGVFVSFGAAGAMSAKADASLTLTGTNVLHAASGRAKKQEVTASGSGSAAGTIAGSLAAGLHVGVQGLANVGAVAQGTLVFQAQGDASFAGSIRRFKKKGEATWLPWSGELTFDADIQGSLIAAASGYFEYQLLWIFEDKFGQFKIGEWTLADAGLHVKGSLKPREGLQIDIKPRIGPLLKPGISPTIRARTQEERDRAEKLAHQNEAGIPRIARKPDLRLARDEDPPPPDAPPTPPDGGGPPAAGASAAAPAEVKIPAEPKIEEA
jgi:hypothetical protein